MASSVTTSHTAHTDCIHDCQPNFSCTLAATCSSDSTICVYELKKDGTFGNLEAVLKGHEAPVWMISWANPMYGTLLASAGYDGKVIAWFQNPSTRHFDACFTSTYHRGSVNAVSWSPPHLGLRLATASSDGTVCEVRCVNGTWTEVITIGSHAVGALCLAWSAFEPTTDIDGIDASTAILCSGGCDGYAKVWKNTSVDGYSWTLLAHVVVKDWIRDVAFDPREPWLLAMASQDRAVRFVRLDQSVLLESGGGAASSEAVPADLTAAAHVLSVPEVPWRLSWNPFGGVIAVTLADESVVLYRETRGQKKGESVWSEVHVVTSQM